MTEPSASAGAEERLAGFMARFTPEIATLARAALARVRAQVPGAVELVYDNYNALVVAFGPSEKTSEAILSIALYPRWVNLFFMWGAKLSDPQRLLEGEGSRVRRIRIDDAATIDEPPVRRLIAQAVGMASPPIEATRPRRMVVKMALARVKPRRPPEAAGRRTGAGTGQGRPRRAATRRRRSI
jgi:hypothetical protein